MAKNEAKIRFLAETEDFRANVAQANSSLNELRSELRLNAEQMKTNGTSVDGLSERQKLLQEQLEQARTKTENLSAQLEASTRIYGENSVEAQKLATQVNNARVAEEKIQQEINKVNAELDQQKAAANQTENALEQLQSTISKQESELSELKNEYAAVALEFGKNSTEAKALAAKISELSGDLNQNRSKLFDVEAAADKAAKKFDFLGREVGDAGDEAEDSASGWTIVKDVIADLASQAVGNAVDAFKDLAFEAEVALDKLQAKTGLSSEAMEYFGDAARDVFNGGWGESLSDVTDAMGVIYNTLGDMDVDTMKEYTENAMTLTDVFGWDTQEQLRAVKSLMDQFGISSDEAFNLMVQGAQNGLDQNGDLLDTINEYSVQFKDAGYSANDMFNMLMNGATTGTWSVDKLGDAVKEMNIRISDGTADEAFKKLKLGIEEAAVSEMKFTKEYENLRNAQVKYNTAVKEHGKNSEQARAAQEKLTTAQAKYNETASETTINISGIKSAFAAGGEEAQGAMKQVMSALMEVEDETERYNLGVQIFGTMWEDLGEDAVNALMTTEGGIKSTNAAMNQVKTDAYDNLATSVTTLGRTLKDEILTPIVEKISPVVKEFVDWCIEHINVVAPIVTGVAVAFGLLATALAIGTIISGVQKAFALLNTTLLANPIVLIIAAIAGLVAAFVGLWNNCEGFRNFFIGMWEGIKNAASVAWQAITGFFTGAWDTIKGVWNGAGEFFSGIWGGIKNVFSNVGGWFSEKFTAARQGVEAAWSGTKQFFSDTWTGIKEVFSETGSWFSQTFTNAKEAVKTAWGDTKQFFSDTWGSIKETYSAVDSYMTNSAFAPAWEGVKKIWGQAGNYFSTVWSSIKGVFSVVKSVLTGNFSDAWNGIKGILSTWKNYFAGIWNGIKSVFSNTKSWFSTTFSNAWQAIKNVFASWGSFWSGLWDKIKNTFTGLGTKLGDAIGGSVKSALNKVFSWVESALNKGIRLINGAIGIINKIPGVSIGKIGELSLPRLASGGVLRAETAFVGGEYPGARNNPEIVTPQSIMRETFADVLNATLDNVLHLDRLAAAIEKLADRPINIDVDGYRLATATAGASDTVSGNRLNLKNRGLAL